METLTPEYFNRHPVKVALDLIGAYLCIETEPKLQKDSHGDRHYLITETASHTGVTIRKNTPNLRVFGYAPGTVALFGRQNGYTLAISTRGQTAVSIRCLRDNSKIDIRNIVLELSLDERINRGNRTLLEGIVYKEGASPESPFVIEGEPIDNNSLFVIKKNIVEATGQTRINRPQYEETMTRYRMR